MIIVRLEQSPKRKKKTNKMNLPLISVVIPNYNRAHLLEGVVESVVKQEYQNIEIIIVDDCSTDNSIEVLTQLSNKIPNLFFYQVPENQGANACRNKGVQLSKGEYIAFLDSDDYFLPDKLTKQFTIFEAYPEVGFVVTGFDAKTIVTLPEGFIPLAETVKQNNLGGFSTLMVKKSAFLEVGGLDTDLLSCQDWDLFLKLLQHHKGYKIAENLVIYEAQADSISKNSTKVIQGYQIVSQRSKEINRSLGLIPEKELIRYQEYYLAMRYFGLKDIDHTRKYLWKSIRTKPSLVPIIYLVAALLGYSCLDMLLKIKRRWLTK